MSLPLIRDYLQTQGIRPPEDEVRMAMLAAQAVMQHPASIENNLLWPPHLTAVLPRDAERNETLRQLFLAVDAAFSREPNASLQLYLKHENQLLRLNGRGRASADCLPASNPATLQTDCQSANENQSHDHLASRAAQTGWLYHVENIKYWQENENLAGDWLPDTPSGGLLAAPIYGENGRIDGVLYAEYAHADHAEQLAQHIGLALACQAPLEQLFCDTPT